LPVAGDVALWPGGVLRGRVVAVADGGRQQPVGGLPVRLLEGGRTVARTATDARGGFVFPGAAGGLYQVVVDTAGGPAGSFYRVWTSPAAPPHAARIVAVPLSTPIVRGQSPLWMADFSTAAAVTAVATGAVAAPIVYHAVKRDPAIPASP
jgi:hypothetical protein